MPDDEMEALLEEIHQSLERAKRTLETMGARTKSEPSMKAVRPPSTPPPTPLPANSSRPSQPPVQPSSGVYSRRQTLPYLEPFLTEQPVPQIPPLPPPLAPDEGRYAFVSERKKGKSGKKSGKK